MMGGVAMVLGIRSAGFCKECEVIDKDALSRLQEAWENPDQKYDCTVRMDGLERDY